MERAESTTAALVADQQPATHVQDSCDQHSSSELAPNTHAQDSNLSAFFVSFQISLLLVLALFVN